VTLGGVAALSGAKRFRGSSAVDCGHCLH